MYNYCAQTVSQIVPNGVHNNEAYTPIRIAHVKGTRLSPISPPAYADCTLIVRRLSTSENVILSLLKSHLFTLSTPPTITSTTYIINNRKERI